MTFTTMDVPAESEDEEASSRRHQDTGGSSTMFAWQDLRRGLQEVANQQVLQQERLVERFLYSSFGNSPSQGATLAFPATSGGVSTTSPSGPPSGDVKIGFQNPLARGRSGSSVQLHPAANNALAKARSGSSLQIGAAYVPSHTSTPEYGVAGSHRAGIGGTSSALDSTQDADTQVSVGSVDRQAPLEGITVSSDLPSRFAPSGSMGRQSSTSDRIRGPSRHGAANGFLKSSHIAQTDLFAPVRDIRFHLSNTLKYAGGPAGDCLHSLVSAPEPRREGCVARFEQTRTFDVLCVMVIFSNALFLIYTTNLEMSRALDDASMDSVWTVDTVETIFLVLYIMELVVKLTVHRLYFFFNADATWNVFDLLVVILAFVDFCISITTDDRGNASVSYLRTLRLLKVSKILRMFRVLRFISELRVLLDCLLGCLSSLFWSLVMMAFMLGLFSVYFVQASTNYLNAGPVDSSVEASLRRRFGTVEEGMLTLFMATSGGMDWIEAYNLVATTGSFNAFIFVFFISLFTVALWNIVTSVFIDRAMRAAAKNVECLAFEKQKEDLQDAKDFMMLFGGLDGDPNRTITMEEFTTKMEDKKFRTYFEVRGLDVKDAEAFYQMLADVHGTEVMTIADFAVSCMRLKGMASSVDQHMNLFELRQLSSYLKIIDNLEHRLEPITEMLEAGLKFYLSPQASPTGMPRHLSSSACVNVVPSSSVQTIGAHPSQKLKHQL